MQYMMKLGDPLVFMVTPSTLLKRISPPPSGYPTIVHLLKLDATFAILLNLLEPVNLKFVQNIIYFS